MSLQINDRVKETSSTTGIVPIVLNGTSVGYQTISSSISSGNTFPYVVELIGGSEWEIGIGQYISSNNSILRTEIINSSNTGHIVNFSAGTKNVFISIPAAYAPLTAKGLSQFANTTSAELASIILGKTGSGNLVFSNNASFSSSDPAVSPFTVTSNVLVTNLNADLLDGQHGSYYSELSNIAYSQASAAYDKANTSASGLIATGIKTSNYIASSNELVRCNTASGSFSITFPSNPIDGDIIAILDLGETFRLHNVTLLSNTKNIEYDTSPYILDLNGAYASFIYNSASTNWKLLESPVTLIDAITTVAVSQGGTGYTSLEANSVLLGNGSSAVKFVSPETEGNLLTSNNGTWVSRPAPISLPSQTGSNGKFLKTDGSSASWVNLPLESVFDQANTALTVGESAFSQANTALTVGESAFSQANTAFNQANVALTTGQSAFSQANTALTVGESAFDQANTALTVGESAFDQANTALTVGESAFSQANAAFSQANTALTVGESAFDQANTALTVGESAFNQANTALTTGQSAFDQANTALTVGESAFDQANTALTVGESAFDQANTALTVGESAFDQANTALTVGESAFDQANTAYNQANVALTTGQSAFSQANVALTTGQSAFSQANTALTVGESAFSQANTKFSSSGGTISGSVTITNDLSVTGNVYLSGNVTTVSSNSVIINDPIIYLANNNVGNVQDIGFVGHFTNSSYQHTGLVRDASDGVWRLFSNVSPEPSSTVDFSNAIYDSLQVGTLISSNAIFTAITGNSPFTVESTTAISNLNADLLDGQHGTYYTGLSSSAFDQANTALSIAQFAFSQANSEPIAKNAFSQANTALTTGQSAFSQANSAYIQANVALTTGQSAFGQANSAFSQANVALSTGQSAFGQANSAFGQANTALSTGQSAFGQANVALTTGQSAFSQANTGITIGQSAFAQANAAYGQANSAYTQANVALTTGQSAFGQANSAFSQANSAYTQANVALTTGQSAFGQANTGITIGQSAFAQANIALTTGQSAFSQANVALTTGQSAFGQANSAFSQANSAYTQANTALTIGQSAFGQANSALLAANSGYNQANIAYTQASAAFAKANTGGGGLTPTAIKTADGYVAVANDLVRCNTAAGAFSVAFPATPADGDVIGIVDIANSFNANNVTLLPNGKTIENDATSLLLDMNGAYVSFVYSSSTSNWKLLETPLGGLTPTAIITSAYTAVINDIVRCNSSTGAFSITLPTSPSDGSLVNVVDVAGTFYTNNVTLLRGGSNTIEGDTSVILDINNAYASFMYNTATANWRLLETPIGSLGNVTANTTVGGIVKISGTVLANATAGVDYLAPPSGTALLKANNSGSLTNATAGVDYVSANTSTTFTKPQTPSTSAETAPATNVVTWDLTTNQIFRINLNANITTFNLTGTLSNLVGNQYEVIIRYNGGSTVSWNTNMKWTAATAPTLTGTSGKIDVLTFVVASTDGTNYYLVNTGIKLNVG